MCGVAGFVEFKNDAPSMDLATRMLNAVRHRGPDGRSVHHFPGAVMAHTRLSIVDIAGGAQPMSNEDRTLWITANCEIFNHAELRNDLIQRGHHFKTTCDTEVILHLYEDLGPDCVNRL